MVLYRQGFWFESGEDGLKEALISFEQENFAVAKTSCRKILEDIKQIVNEWKTVDDSQSMCEKLQKIVGSLYSFASIGGLAHEGVTTKAETELILKNTTSLLFYINFLLKNDKASGINSQTKFFLKYEGW